ncbi:hypothetical protein V2J09_014178 [Rumex salicifolius]
MPKIPLGFWVLFSGHSNADNKLKVQLEQIQSEAQSGKEQLKYETIQPTSRRHSLIYYGSSLASILVPKPSWANDKSDEDEEEGVAGAFKSFFDPNEKTKTGKVLPKAYLKSAREVVKTLRDSLKEDAKDAAKFRRTADGAKESIREYLSNWRGQQSVSKEESYIKLEKVIRSLASFYSKAGPSGVLPDEVKSDILHDLDVAEEFL